MGVEEMETQAVDNFSKGSAVKECGAKKLLGKTDVTKFILE
jgi:hypothetical protein